LKPLDSHSYAYARLEASEELDTATIEVK